MNPTISDRLTALCGKPLSQVEDRELYLALLQITQEEADHHIQKQRHYFANKGPSSQGYGFSSGHVWM